MFQFDLKTYTEKFIDMNEYNRLMSLKDSYIAKLNSCEMTGWMDEISPELVNDIKETANYVKNNFDCLVVVGIGGSFLGSYAFHNMFKSYFNDKSYEVIYAGYTLSSKYLDELLKYLEHKNFCLNVISKSGTTMETSITYKVIKDLLKRKYGEEIRKHIIVTTDEVKGILREEVNEAHYKSFTIPNNIGGRYSFITPAHLLPLALNYNLTEIIDGYYDGKRLIDYAYNYAVVRKLLFDKGKYVENFCVYEENLLSFTEWLKQLFGETEGKNGKGIFPTSNIHTRDLHSLGQFIQEGNKIIFETFIKINNSKNYINYNNKELHEINNIVEDSVMRAHYSGNVPCIEITIDNLTPEVVSSLIYFFQLSASFSGLLFGVDPFNQPGVEVYKKEVKDALNRQ